jgi:hypothetical protein
MSQTENSSAVCYIAATNHLCAITPNESQVGNNVV